VYHFNNLFNKFNSNATTIGSITTLLFTISFVSQYSFHSGKVSFHSLYLKLITSSKFVEGNLYINLFVESSFKSIQDSSSNSLFVTLLLSSIYNCSVISTFHFGIPQLPSFESLLIATIFH